MDTSGIKTIEDFAKALASQYTQQNEEDTDETEFKYVIYARKSTKGSRKKNREKQQESIPAQVKACKEHVKTHGLNPPRRKDIIEEKQSAKEPEIRPKFRQMLRDVEDGVYDGIIAYHPDRLARNMKDAGQLIDMLDKGQIKSLRFSTYTFENNPMGKMLLGISFVMSKQYSDHLSVVVKRGNSRKLSKGHYIGDPPHGYMKDGRQYLYPNGSNWNLIQKAFEMRLEGTAQADIAKWLNKMGYQKRAKNKDTPVNMTKQKVSKMLAMPEYAGVSNYGSDVFLFNDFYDFTPVITLEEYDQINDIGTLMARFRANLVQIQRT